MCVCGGWGGGGEWDCLICLQGHELLQSLLPEILTSKFVGVCE